MFGLIAKTVVLPLFLELMKIIISYISCDVNKLYKKNMGLILEHTN